MVFGFSGHQAQVRLASQILNIFVGGLGSSAPAVMYYRLRSVKESIDVRDLASVFD
jgi:hypothetical protein